MAPKKVKKSKTKKKGKKTDKDNIEKQADLFIQSENLHKLFIDRISTWLLSHFARVIDIFRRFDRNGDGTLTYDEFFAGMRDLQAPCNKLELYVLAKTVDKNLDGRIEYTEFSQGIKYRRPVKVKQDDGLPVLKIARESFQKCADCSIKKWEPKEKKSGFISLTLILESMKGIPNYPGHLRSCIVEANITTQGLVDRIQSIYDHTFKDIAIFSFKDGCRSILDISDSLESIGYQGACEEYPTCVTLYYEFGENKIVDLDCPILQCDHYFSRKKT